VVCLSVTSSGELDATSTHSDRSLKPADLLLLAAAATTTSLSSSKCPTTLATTQLAVGVVGIYTTFLYHGHVQEDLYGYRSPSSDKGYALVWSHLARKRSVGCIGMGRTTVVLVVGASQLFRKYH
jgi:hypothetical protein